MARGQPDPSAADAASPSSSSLRLSSARATGVSWRALLHKMLEQAAEAAYQRHRLRFVHVEDDGSFTYVCICGDGFSQRENWNKHITESFSELIDD